jgi:WD40 repeat protein
VFTLHSTRVNGIAVAPDSSLVASCDQDGLVSVWDAGTLRSKWTRRRPGTGPCYAVAFSPDGRWLATSDVLLSARDGSETMALGEQGYGTAFSPDRRLLVRTDRPETLHLWDVERRARIQTRTERGATFVSAAYSPDGQWVVTGETEGLVRLWAGGSLDPVAVLGRHTARVRSVSFSPGGSRVVTAGDDGAVLVWDLVRRRLAGRVGSYSGPVLATAFAPDGRLAVGADDHSVRIYTPTETLWDYPLGSFWRRPVR